MRQLMNCTVVVAITVCVHSCLN